MNLMNCVVPHQFSQEKSQYHFHIIKKEDPVFIFEKKAIFHFFISWNVSSSSTPHFYDVPKVKNVSL
jgi:hypothetical protein